MFQFEKATIIRPQDYESAFNAGVAFRLAGKNDLAEKFYRMALRLKPEVTNIVNRKVPCMIRNR